MQAMGGVGRAAAHALTAPPPLSPLTQPPIPPRSQQKQVFKQLARLPPTATPEEEALYTQPLPFRTFEYPGEVHPGLRAYPFLAQARLPAE